MSDIKSLSSAEAHVSGEKDVEVASVHDGDFTRQEERALLRKFDFCLLPPLTIMCVAPALF